MGPEKRLLFAPQTKYFKMFNVHFLRPFCLIQELLSALRSEVGWPRTKVVFAENITPLFGNFQNLTTFLFSNLESISLAIMVEDCPYLMMQYHPLIDSVDDIVFKVFF